MDRFWKKHIEDKIEATFEKLPIRSVAVFPLQDVGLDGLTQFPATGVYREVGAQLPRGGSRCLFFRTCGFHAYTSTLALSRQLALIRSGRFSPSLSHSHSLNSQFSILLPNSIHIFLPFPLPSVRLTMAFSYWIQPNPIRKSIHSAASWQPSEQVSVNYGNGGCGTIHRIVFIHDGRSSETQTGHRWELRRSEIL